ncbi:hypothetical protein HHK36_006217 [Tetracentron sinense]|uniref:Uncharacterized protein n=1 Tax=Tetracentron sinense TaxID=13715 RepID=A0A834ZRG2_TETSI|nr:hypothetical protein HHK36_006217 [Tetracentron sinense]
MSYQSNGRNQRPKGFKVKWALQFALLLAVCIWLLYQIRHSHDKRKDYGGSVQNKLHDKDGILILGRKGNAGFNNEVEGDSKDGYRIGEGEKKEDGGGGDDELDGSTEEKAEEESFHKDHEKSQGNVANYEEKEDEKEPEIQHKESQSNEENNTHTRVREGDEEVGLDKDVSKEDSSSKGHEDLQEGFMNHEEDEKEPERQSKTPQINEEDNNITQLRDGKVQDEDSKKSEEEIKLQRSETESPTGPGKSEIENGVHGFHDENGVPQDGHDLINSTPSDDQARNLHQETIPSSNNQSRHTENLTMVAEEFTNSSQEREQIDTEKPIGNMTFKADEVTSQEGRNTADSENENKSTPEGSKVDTGDFAEISSQSGDNYDTSSANQTSETKQEDNKVSENSSSVHSQQEKGEGADRKILPEAESEAEKTE